MARKRAIIIMPKLIDSGGDLSKKWFVEYSCRNPRTDKMQRFRVYEGFNSLHTTKERYKLAESIISKISAELSIGITPFSDSKKEVVYEDELMYHHAARIWGNQKSSVVTIRTHLNEFLQLKKLEVIHHTYQTYKSKLRIFCMYMESVKLDKVHVSLITQENISDFILFMVSENKISRRTVLKYRQILYNFFDFLLKRKK